MSDDLEPAEPDTATEPVVETTDTPDEPFAGEFDPDRARALIDKLRPYEKKAAEYERLLSDPEQFTQHGVQQGWLELPEVPEEPEPEYQDPTEVLERRLAEIEAWKDERNAEITAQDFNKHLDELASAKDVTLTERDRRALLQDSVMAGFTRADTERVFNELLEEREAYRQSVIDGYVKSKQAPSAPTAGQPAERSFDPLSESERLERLAAALTPPPQV